MRVRMKYKKSRLKSFFVVALVIIASPPDLFSKLDNTGVQLEWTDDLGGVDGAGQGGDDGFDDDFDNPFGEPYPPERDPFGDEPRPGHVPPVIGGEEDPEDGEDEGGDGGSSGGSGGGSGGEGEEIFYGGYNPDIKELRVTERKEVDKRIDRARSQGGEEGPKESLEKALDHFDSSTPVSDSGAEGDANQDSSNGESESGTDSEGRDPVGPGLQPINVIA